MLFVVVVVVVGPIDQPVTDSRSRTVGHGQSVTDSRSQTVGHRTYRRPGGHWRGVGSARSACSMSASSSHTTGATRQEPPGRRLGVWGGIPGPLHCVVQPGQCICLHVLGTWSVRKNENKTGEKHGPPCLARVQSPRCPDVLQIAVVSPDEKRVFSPLKPMSPRLQSLDDSQQLPVPHVIASVALREHGSYPSLGLVHLHYE
jgi:hypothetical protein